MLEQKKRGFTEYSEDRPDGDVCRKCYDLAQDTRIIPFCKHRFCKTCIEGQTLVDDGQGKPVGEQSYLILSTHCANLLKEPECPICGATFDVTSLKTPAQLKPKKKTKSPNSKSEKSDSKGQKSAHKNLDKKAEKKTKNKLKPKGMDYLGTMPLHSPMPWLMDFDAGTSEMPPSTKLKGLEDQIKEWMTTAPSDKIIIFTQWRTFTAIVGRVLERNNTGFVYFTVRSIVLKIAWRLLLTSTQGDMSTTARQKATTAFRSDASIKVMVATLKTAGEGLNLEFANRVVST